MHCLQTSSILKFSSAVQPKNLTSSIQNFSAAATATFHSIRFERLVYLFLVRSLAVRSAIRTVDTVRSIFTWEVTNWYQLYCQ